MTKKFHVNDKGESGQCGALKGGCPFGGESGQENHYDTPEAAREAYEKKNASETFSSLSRKKKVEPKELTIGDFPPPSKLYALDLEPLEPTEIRYADYSDRTIYSKEIKAFNEYTAEHKIRDSTPEGEAYFKGWQNRYRKILTLKGIESDRLSKNLIFAQMNNDNRSMKEVIESGDFAEKEAPAVRTNFAKLMNEVSQEITNMNPKTRERIYNLPGKYMNSFTGENDKVFSSSNLKIIVDIAESINKKNADFDPMTKVVRPTSNESDRYDPAYRIRMGYRGVQGIQGVGLSTQLTNLLEQNVIDKFGDEGAIKFWKTLSSGTYNRPTIAKYAKHIKDIEKANNEK